MGRGLSPFLFPLPSGFTYNLTPQVMFIKVGFTIYLLKENFKDILNDSKNITTNKYIWFCYSD